MKNFFTSLLGSLVALLIFSAGSVLVLIGLAGALAALGKGGGRTVAEVEPNSYLVFKLDANLTDAPPAFDLGELTGRKESTLQLRAVTRAIRAAGRDARISGLLLTGELSPSGYGTGFAALKELRAAILGFKATGKPVVAFLTEATTKDYYLASAASEITLDPYGALLLPGLASEQIFYAGAFKKYGIGVQVTRVGKYKSFVEPYTREDMSPENREQIQKLLDDVWGGLLADIATTRGLTAPKIQAVVDATGLIRAEPARAAKLIDRVAYRDEVLDELKSRTGQTGNRPFRQVDLDDYLKQAGDSSLGVASGAENGAGPRRIAVMYAEGEIVDGEGKPGEVGGDKFSRELRAMRLDAGVKAVVLRVNSPGGSVTASEAIQREVRLTRKVKPVVVSMGSYAASGGYWISTYADRIFAEPTTITGSIGVFGIQFDVQKLANDFGVTFDSVKTGKFADAATITRPKTPEELAVAQDMVDWIYGQFIAKVAESRHLSRAFVEDIAQGRVWSGTEATKLGLVDELGGLDAAVTAAALQARLGTSYRLVEYPRKREFSEVVRDLLEKVPSMHLELQGVAGQVAHRLERELQVLSRFTDPHGVYARLPVDLTIR